MPRLARKGSDSKVRVDCGRASVLCLCFTNHKQLDLLRLSHFFHRPRGPFLPQFGPQPRFELTFSSWTEPGQTTWPQPGKHDWFWVVAYIIMNIFRR